MELIKSHASKRNSRRHILSSLEVSAAAAIITTTTIASTIAAAIAAIDGLPQKHASQKTTTKT